MNINKLLFYFALAFSSHFTFASKLPVEAFSQIPSVENFRLSPSGKKIVYIRNTLEKGVSFIVMIDMTTGDKRVLGMTDNHGEHFLWLRWANEDIVLGGVSLSTRRKGQRLIETRLYKFYVDGKRKSETVYSPRIFKLSRKKWEPLYQDNVIDWLPEDHDHVLISMIIHSDDYPSVFKLNVNDGSVKTIQREKLEVYSWMTDQQHNVRLGQSLDYERPKIRKIWLKDLKKDDWTLAWEYQYNSIDIIHPKGFDLDGNILYFTKYHKGKLALFTKNLTSQEETLLYSDPVYDVLGGLIYSPKTHDVVGFNHESLPSGRYFFDQDYQDSENAINNTLKATKNYLVSTSDDLNTYVIYADASDIPGTYYLGNKKEKSLSKLFSTYPNLDPKLMAGSKKVRYTTRDGTEIEAYLSIPQGVSKPIATVIHPHGGPGSKDFGWFDAWTEFLINRGYAVLRPNFRGSTGYGYEFSQARNAAWGMAMQDDITDGVKWLIDNKITDPEKVCIFGASYGGYAALMGAIKTPDLFKCAISFAGVTDLVALRNEYRRTRFYKIAKDELGDNDSEMKKNSPRYRVNEIKIPILLLHGEKDKIVEIEHSQWMVSELEAAKKTYKFVELADGAHNLWIQENRTSVFKEVGEFLDKYLQTSSSKK